MQKFLLTFLFALLAIPSISFAASDDVTLTTGVVINVAGINLTISGSSATLASLVVNSDSFDVGLESGSSITVASADRRTFTLSPSNGAFSQSTDCTSSQSTLTLTGTGTITLTVTPTSSTCTVASSGGGGGGVIAGTFDKPDGPFSVVVNAGAAVTKTKDVKLTLLAGSNVKSMAISSHKADLSDAALVNYQPSVTWDLCSKLGGLVKLQADQCTEGLYTVYVRFFTRHGQRSEIFSDTIEYRKSGIATVAQTPTDQAGSITFSRTLRRGSTGDDVKSLQKLLNTHGILVAASGVGSPGNETNYFGSLTEKAVQKFQAQYEIVSSGSPETTGYGLIGPKTRAKLNEVFGGATVAEIPSTESVAVPTAITKGTFTNTLRIGNVSEEVRRLQQFLNTDPDTKLADSGAGSPGSETAYFGPITENAVQRFQAKYGIVSSGNAQTTGYGLVGPKTRAKLNELFTASE